MLKRAFCLLLLIFSVLKPDLLDTSNRSFGFAIESDLDTEAGLPRDMHRPFLVDYFLVILLQLCVGWSNLIHLQNR